MTTLREEIYSKCTQELIEARDCAAIADVVNANRYKANGREIGNGTILETIGLAAGNTLLDVLTYNDTFRYVKPLLEQGRLIISSPLVVATLQTLVPSVITQEQANSLINLGKVENKVSPYEISTVLYNPDGSIK